MRTVLGVVIAFVAMSAVVFAASVAPWFAVGLDAVLQPGRFDSTVSFNVYAVLVGILGALFAGRLCATIAPSRIAVISLAALCFAAGMTNALAQMNKPIPGGREPGVTVAEAIARRKEPAWFTLLMPCVGVAGVLLGGRVRTQR
jgi:carbonic anhydrase/acetyltransferase-like protein (isoleucine patch superfamily)